MFEKSEKILGNSVIQGNSKFFDPYFPRGTRRDAVAEWPFSVNKTLSNTKIIKLFQLLSCTFLGQLSGIFSFFDTFATKKLVIYEKIALINKNNRKSYGI